MKESQQEQLVTSQTQQPGHNLEADVPSVERKERRVAAAAVPALERKVNFWDFGLEM